MIDKEKLIEKVKIEVEEKKDKIELKAMAKRILLIEKRDKDLLKYNNIKILFDLY